MIQAIDLIPFCENIEDHVEINEFVLYSCWSIPGLNILHDKCMKRQDKRRMLHQKAGEYGPIMDMVIRGTVYHMLIFHFDEHTRKIGKLMLDFTKSHFRDQKIVHTIDNWSKTPGSLADYEGGYRHKRAELISTQISFLVNNPRNLVILAKIHNSPMILLFVDFRYMIL